MGYLKSKAAILQYQNISEDTDNFLDTWIYYKSFEEQLDHLSKNNVPIIPLDDAVAYIKGHLKLQRQSFSLTFDTGFLELYTLCFPLLKKYGYPATFFIRPDTVGGEGKIGKKLVKYMDWDQICNLAENGMTIGLYGCKGGNLSETPLAEIEKEILEGKTLLRSKLKGETVYYGVREGIPTRHMIRSFKKEGFRAAFCQTPTKQKTNPYNIGRIQVDDNDLNIFLVKISKAYIFFKDSRYWKYLRRYKIDRASHWISDTINRLKGKEVY